MKKKSQKINELKKVTVSKLNQEKINGGVAAGGHLECVEGSRRFVYVKNKE